MFCLLKIFLIVNALSFIEAGKQNASSLAQQNQLNNRKSLIDSQEEESEMVSAISSVCYDQIQRKFYKIGESWTGPGCINYQCELHKLPKIRNIDIAIGVEQICYIPKYTESHCQVLPKNLTLSFPNCCPLEVCILGSYVFVTGTSADGVKLSLSTKITDEEKLVLTSMQRFGFLAPLVGWGISKIMEDNDKPAPAPPTTTTATKAPRSRLG